MDIIQAFFPAQAEAAATGPSGDGFRPDWKSLRARLGAAHALLRVLERPESCESRGSFASMATLQTRAFAGSTGGFGEQGKGPVNPKALSNGKGGRAIAVDTVGSLMAGGRG